MHSYATDSKERQKITFGLAAIAIGAAWALSRLFVFVNFTVPWWVDAPSTMGVFGLFYTAFDKVLWRKGWVYRIGLVKVPDLEGCWQGNVCTSYDQSTGQHDVSVRIKQTWTEISLILESETSISHTLVAALQVNAPEGAVLSYQFINEPKPGAPETMQIHRGTARLVLRDANNLEGDYYTGRGRQEYGSINLRKVQ